MELNEKRERQNTSGWTKHGNSFNLGSRLTQFDNRRSGNHQSQWDLLSAPRGYLLTLSQEAKIFLLGVLKESLGDL